MYIVGFLEGESNSQAVENDIQSVVDNARIRGELVNRARYAPTLAVDKRVKWKYEVSQNILNALRARHSVEYVWEVQLNENDMKQDIVRYMCPQHTVAEVEEKLRKIKAKTGHISAFRSFHDTDNLSGSSNVFQGPEYRNLEDREDRNTFGPKRDRMMSENYHYQTTVRQNPDSSKRISQGEFKRLKRQQGEKLKSKDQHMKDAIDAFSDMSSRLLWQGSQKKARILFSRYLNSVKKLTNKELVFAACMFHLIKKSSGGMSLKLLNGRKKRPSPFAKKIFVVVGAANFQALTETPALETRSPIAESRARRIRREKHREKQRRKISKKSFLISRNLGAPVFF